MMSRTIQLLKLILIIASFIFICFPANAQIIYTDLPDTSITRTENLPGTLSYVLDINNDNVNDYNIAVRSENIPPTGCSITPNYQTNLSSWIGTMPLYSNSIGDSAGNVAIVQLDSLISNTSHTWSTSQQNNLYFKEYTYPSCTWDSSFTGYWFHDITGYIALKFKVGTNIHYGWLRINLKDDIDSTGNWYISLTVMDYAYNSQPGQSIRAGETNITSVFEPGSFNSVNLFFDNKGDEIIIQKKSIDKWKLTVFNQHGKIVSVSELNGKYSKLDFSDQSIGVYIYRITDKDTFITSGKFLKN